MTAPLDENRPAHILPLGELNFWTWRGHKSAQWWLRFLYCRPEKFNNLLIDLANESRSGALRTGAALFVAALPYALLLAIAGRLVLTMLVSGLLPWEAVGDVATWAKLPIVSLFFIWFLLGFLLGFLFGFLLGFSSVFSSVFSRYKSFELDLGGASALASLLASILSFGAIFEPSSGPTAGLKGGLTFVAVGVGAWISLTICILRLYNDLPHALLMFPRPRGRFYRFHPAAWDEGRRVVYLGLHRLLVDYATYDFDKASREIDRLIDLGPQASEALKAKAILLIRDAAGAVLPVVANTLADLPEGDKGWLAQTKQVKQSAQEISALALQIDQLRQPVVRARAINDLITRIMAFQGTVSGLRYPLAGELRSAAAKWLEQAQAMRIAAEQAAAGVEATPQVFRAGDPVNRQSEAFVSRYAVVDELAQQALLATGCPGILLYGRRRTGKSSILKAFDGVLPPNLLSRSASLQDPQVAADVGRLCGKLAMMAADGAGLAEKPPESVDLPGLMDMLNRADATLAQSGKRLILALDEYERLDGLVGEGRVPLDFLHMLRESIQTHRHLVWLLAGSHHYEHLPHVPWTSYLISMRQVDVTMFTDEESRRLLTDPLAFSPLFRDDETRPRFSDAFWGVDAAGEGGVAWIQRQSGGWPHLVQLLAERAVEEVNKRSAAAFDSAWRETVLKRAVAEGAPVLGELLLGSQENRTEAERDYVAAFAHASAQAAPADRAVRAHLLRREIIERGEDGLWRLRVPLMRRWIEANRDYL